MLTILEEVVASICCVAISTDMTQVAAGAGPTSWSDSARRSLLDGKWRRSGRLHLDEEEEEED